MKNYAFDVKLLGAILERTVEEGTTVTKLEQLKAAFEAATPGEWHRKSRHEGAVLDRDGRMVAAVCTSDDARAIALSHSLMPTLLEAIDLLETVSSARACQDHEFDVDAWFRQVRSLLGDLK